MVVDTSGCAKLGRKLAALSQQKATGKLLLGKGDRQWQLYFFQGKLLYATGGTHRVRRWTRALRQHCPTFAPDVKQVSEKEPWEYQLLHIGVKAGQLNVNQAKAVIRTTALEVFFGIVRNPPETSSWKSTPPMEAEIPLSLPLSSLDVGQVLQNAENLWQQWQEMGLSYLCPDSAPVLKEPRQLKNQVSSESFLSLNNLFNGENTLWDIALKRKQSVIGVTRTLHHFVQQGQIVLREVLDWPSVIEQWRLVRAAVNRYQPLIACIDDSPVVAERLEQILAPEGYRVIKIQDPMQGVATIAEKKPDLIFLDVVMPQTNGYNLCSFLRQSTLFRETPIIILTSRDSIIDRTRAKLTGASDFLNKPPEPKQVLEIVRKYLQVREPEAFPIASPAMA